MNRREIVLEMGRDGGCVPACAKALRQGTPVENAAAIPEELLAGRSGGRSMGRRRLRFSLRLSCAGAIRVVEYDPQFIVTDGVV